MHLSRTRIRALLAVVVVALLLGVGLGVSRLIRLHGRYRDRALEHERRLARAMSDRISQEREIARLVARIRDLEEAEPAPDDADGEAESDAAELESLRHQLGERHAEIARDDRVATYENRQAIKYRTAARQPWRSLPPDPPPPE